MSFLYPTSVELTTIAQDKMPRMIANRPIFDILPVRKVDTHTLRWEQKDNYVGLQQVRGLGGEPPRVKRIGSKTYQMDPGVYGEKSDIDEIELTTRRPFGQWDGQVSIEDLVMELQDQLLLRELDRIEQIGWTLLTTGTFSISGPGGVVMHTDSFTLTTYAAGVAWGTSATATPLADFRAVKLLGRGKSVNFGTGAVAYMNQTTANQLLTNTNANDLAGRRTSGLASVASMADVQTLLAGEDLPRIVVYDEGYIDESNTFQLFIPNNKVVVVGQRPAGQTVGEYRMTRNASNPGMAPGSYTKVVDNGDEAVPRLITVHHGHNGGPVLYFPSAIVVMTV